MSLKWTDTLDIAIELDEKHPDVESATVTLDKEEAELESSTELDLDQLKPLFKEGIYDIHGLDEAMPVKAPMPMIGERGTF